MTATQNSCRKKRRRLPFCSGFSVAACFSALVCLTARSSFTSAAATTFGASNSARMQRHHRWIAFDRKNRVLEPHESLSLSRSSLPASLPRGGSTDQDFLSEDEEDDEEEQEEEEEEEGEEEEENTSTPTTPPSSSSEPLTVTIKTNLQNSLIDQSIELLVTPSRTISSVKQTLSRMLPSRPPVSLLRLIHDSVLLSDDDIVSELVDDEDDDEEEERGLTLVLDIVPPVDPKFAVEALSKMQELSTMDLLEAYATNVVAMNANSAAMLTTTDDNMNDNNMSPLYSVQLRQQALALQQQLESQYSTEQLESWREAPKLAEEAQQQVQIRGQRVRMGSKGGARSSMKRTLQRNLNINWPDTIRNFLLFLFFGLFGGRSVISRNLLLLGAPMCFVLQARPAKIMLKQVFYACSNPPSILLSLLPAPEQAILSFDYKEAWDELYGESKKKAGQRAISTDEEMGEEADSDGELSDVDGGDSSGDEEESESDGDESEED